MKGLCANERKKAPWDRFDGIKWNCIDGELSQRLQFRNCTSVLMPAAVELQFRVFLLTFSIPQIVLGITFLFV